MGRCGAYTSCWWCLLHPSFLSLFTNEDIDFLLSPDFYYIFCTAVISVHCLHWIPRAEVAFTAIQQHFQSVRHACFDTVYTEMESREENNALNSPWLLLKSISQKYIPGLHWRTNIELSIGIIWSRLRPGLASQGCGHCAQSVSHARLSRGDLHLWFSP